MIKSADTLAAEVAAEFRPHMVYCVAKIGKRCDIPNAELWQAALEGVLLFAGLVELINRNTGKPVANYGKLAEWRQMDSDTCNRYVQHALDWHVGQYVAHQIQYRTASCRGNATPVSTEMLEAWEDRKPDRETVTPGGIDVSEESADLSAWPILCRLHLRGMKALAIRAELFLSDDDYKSQLAKETAELTAWAVRNRRVSTRNSEDAAA